MQDLGSKIPHKQMDIRVRLFFGFVLLGSVLNFTIKVQAVAAPVIQPALLADFLYISLILLSVKRVTAGALLVFILFNVTALLFISTSIRNGMPLLEAIRAVKWLFLLSLLYLLKNPKPLPGGTVTLMAKILLVITFFVYSITQIFSGFKARPTLLVENNFEVLLISLLVLGYFWENQKSGKVFPFKWIIAYLSVAILSLSLSGIILALISGSYMAGLRASSTKKSKNAFNLLGLATVVATSFFANYRLSLAGGQDRIYFLSIFMQEMRSKDFFNLLVPSFNLQPLNSSSCLSLLNWSKLFSSNQEVLCYSVIFHSFFLRIIYDFGILITIFSVIFLYRVLLRSIERKSAKVLTLLVLMNGLSVSSMNSSFLYIGLVLIMCSELGNSPKLIEEKSNLKHSQ